MEPEFPRLYTSSQESMIMADVHLSDLEQLFDAQEPLEVKYDISQPMAAPPPQEQQQQQPLILPIEHLPQAQMPTTEEFQGEFNFHLTPDQQGDTKSWTYSQKMKKVFIEMEKTLPIRIKWTPTCNGLYIRAGMAFCEPAYRSEPVMRCHNHRALSKQESRHVLSCKHTSARYDEIHEHHSVRVPLGTPQPGSDSVQMDFVFHCKNSCSSGINRKHTEVVFNLENEQGVVLGCSKLFVRICSCPKRDREKEEKAMRESPAPKKRKLASSKKCMPIYRGQPQLETESDIFTFSARIYGRENFETLRRIAYGLMVETMDHTGQQAVIRPLLDELNRMR